MGGGAIDDDGVAAAFEPEDAAVGCPDLEILYDHLAAFDAALNGGGDDGDVLGKEDFLEALVVGDVGQGMAEDGVGADSVGDLAGGVFDVPGGDEGGLLDGGEEFLLLAEDQIGLAAGSDIAKEDDDAVVEGAALKGEPEVQWLGVKDLELAGDALVHGAMVVIANFGGSSGFGKLLPEIFAEEIAFGAEQFLGAAVEEGEVPVAVDDGHLVAGVLESLPYAA